MNQRKADRQKEAEQRRIAYAKLSRKEKLAKLDARLGANIGAVRQRVRLEKERGVNP